MVNNTTVSIHSGRVRHSRHPTATIAVRMNNERSRNCGWNFKSHQRRQCRKCRQRRAGCQARRGMRDPQRRCYRPRSILQVQARRSPQWSTAVTPVGGVSPATRITPLPRTPSWPQKAGSIGTESGVWTCRDSTTYRLRSTSNRTALARRSPARDADELPVGLLGALTGSHEPLPAKRPIGTARRS